MSGTTTKIFQGEISQGSKSSTTGTEDREDAKHVCERSFVVNLGRPGSDAHFLAFKAQADLTITKAVIVPAGAHSADANSPDIGLQKSDTATGALTDVHSAVKDGTSGNYVDRTEIELSLDLDETDITEGQYVWVEASENGTPAVIDCDLLVRIDYELSN